MDLNQEFLDVRDMIKRFEELESDRDGYVLGAPDGSETPNPEGWAEDNPEDAEELETLESALGDLAGMGGDEEWRGDWYPVTLIRESDFTDYCRESLSEWGYLPAELPGFIAIDYEKTADNMRIDYSEAEIDGTTYLYR